MPKLPKESPSKEELFENILNAAVELDLQKGHCKWTMSELARKTGVTRSLIYYYFGKTPFNILKDAVKVLGDQIWGFIEQEQFVLKEDHLADSIIIARGLMDALPHLLGFYVIQRRSTGEIGETLRESERRYVQRLKQLYPDKSDAVLRALFGAICGFVVAPEVTEDAIRQGIKTAMRALNES